MKKTMGKIGRVMGRMATNTILVQPIRILIIINSIFLPLLLGTLVFIILKYAQDIKGIIDKAKKIEGMVEDNIKEGIEIIKEGYAQAQQVGAGTLEFAKEHITPTNTKKFIKNNLLEPLILYINPELENVKTKVQEFINVVWGVAVIQGYIKLEEFTTILDVSGKSVNNIIKSIEPMLLSDELCKPEQINKVLSENRSIAYILTHNKLNN
tara:strand:- start:5102 stop:5731 length:630 start_codon:yes stop_codon:yes gene_type:complete